MQLLKSEEIVSEGCEFSEKPDKEETVKDFGIDEDVVLDVSGKSVEFLLSENPEDSVESLYLYKNVYSLIPKSLGGLGSLRRLKFFGNEINLFGPEFGSPTGLESLQIKISMPGIGGLSLHKLKGLKELELSKVPYQLSPFPILNEIVGLNCLTKLSICHFSMSYLPPEIGFLKNLEYLDVSFNKLKTLPPEIGYLTGLLSLKIANNKLAELPSAMSSLSSLENLDLSNNRLTSLGFLELGSMCKLQNLNLQYNKLLGNFHIPSWICCKLEGNDRGTCNDDFGSSSFEMDTYETTNLQDRDGTLCHGSHASSSASSNTSSNNRCFTARKPGKRWKRWCYLQKKACQERLNNSQKRKGVGHAELLSEKMNKTCEPGNSLSCVSQSCRETVADNPSLDDNAKSIFSEKSGINNMDNNVDNFEKQLTRKDCCLADGKDGTDASLSPSKDRHSEEDEASCSEIYKCYKSKRHSDEDLVNPKPCKSRKPICDSSLLSLKYSRISFCGFEDLLPDGFYDAGRDQPFMLLENYEQNQCLHSREVILLDRERDEELDAITVAAQALLFQLKQQNDSVIHGNEAAVGNLQVASLLALFVSDHFGGSDRYAIVERMRKSVSGSNCQKPFVCTCSTGSSSNIIAFPKPLVDTAEDITLSKICEKSLYSIKERQSSIIVPIGTLQFGVCRHRALLLKYLCDHMDPPLPCELVRGYLDFSPHAWNIVLIKRDDTWVRMLVDACRPHDIREEKDPEYFCRYIPLSRTKVPLSTRASPGPGCSFPSLSLCEEIEKLASSTLVRCKFGSVEAAAKVRTLEVPHSSANEIRNFEYSCLGEVRILEVLKHPCIVELYGHQISCKWTCSKDGNPERRILRSAIFMEYVEGGSLRNYLGKLSKAGTKHVPAELALCIAREVACALLEMHKKQIIHRDLKSENILIDLDRKRDDGTPTVKLCDFDSAVPLRSPLHKCCIAHVGIPPPYVCVGTPRWMAPEVMQTAYKQDTYGLEADIWSFGCLLLELLTLQVPYPEVPDLQFHDVLQRGIRPKLTEEMEALSSLNEPTMVQSGEELEKSDVAANILKFLVHLFHRCLQDDPTKRPVAQEIYEMLLSHSSHIQEIHT